MGEREDVCDGKLKDYMTPLKQIIFFRLMKQLSEVYSNMTIENFERAASIVPFSMAEKWMANAARQHGISIQINYSQKAIVFGSPRKVDMKSMRQPLIEIGAKLQQAMSRVAPEEQLKKEKAEKQQLQQNLVARCKEESKMIRARKEEIERRKEESEQRKMVQEKEARRQEEERIRKEEESERQRQEEERKRRDEERKKQQADDKKRREAENMLKDLQAKSADLNKAMTVGGKKINDITAEDLKDITADQIEAARQVQLKRDRQEKIRNRKMESKRVDHLARALREEERPLLNKWKDQIQREDDKFLEKAESQNADEQYKKHEEALKEKNSLIAFRDGKEAWCAEKLEDREADWEEARGAQERKLKGKVAQNKIERAKERLEAHRKEMKTRLDQKRAEQEKEEKKRKDEEKRRREEEEAEE